MTHTRQNYLPAVSVVVPVYNKADVVERTLRSICEQTFGDIEIIVVDDGSKDASLAVIQRAADSRIRVISQANGGEAAARNCGIAAARAEYVAFLDADDQWLPNHLELSMRILRAHPDLQWCCSAFERRSVSGKRLASPVAAQLPLREGCSFDDYLAIGALGGMFCTNGMVIRRGVFAEVGGFDPSLKCGTDQDMWFRIALAHGRIGYNSIVTSIYHLHGSSVSQQLSGRPRNMLGALARHRQRAADCSPSALGRMETWTALWAHEIVKAAIRHSDTQALEDVGSLYGQHLRGKWKQLRRLFLSSPGALLPLARWGMNTMRRLRMGGGRGRPKAAA